MDLRNGESVVASRSIPVAFWVVCALKSLLVFTIPFVILEIVRAVTNQFHITSERVYGKYGVFGTSEFDIPLDKVSSVKSEQGIFGKIFNFGYIVVTNSASEHARWITSNPVDLKNTLANAQDRQKDNQIRKMASAMKSA